MDWNGKHAIVTGGSSGIGKAIAQRLAREGTNVSLIARGKTHLNEAAGEIGGSVRTFSADVSNSAEAKSAIDRAIEAFGAPELLVTSAGIAHPGRFEELPLEIHERTMAVNYFGTLYCVHAVLPSMRAAGRGHISLISSGAGLIGLFGYTPYSPTKFALRGLAESLRAELKPMGIGVSIVYPPDTDTPQLVEENKTKPEETKTMTGTAKMWSADGVARVTLSGIERNRFAITPGIEMTLLYRLNSLIVPGLARYFDHVAAGFTRRRGRD